MVVVQIADGWVSRAGTRATHPPTHSALRAGPRCWQSSEYRASPAPRFNSEGRGAGGQGGTWSRTCASCSSERVLAPHRPGDTHHGSGSPPVFINLVTGKARYSEPCLSRGPARSAEWAAGWFCPAQSAEWADGWFRPARSADWAGASAASPPP